MENIRFPCILGDALFQMMVASSRWFVRLSFTSARKIGPSETQKRTTEPPKLLPKHWPFGDVGRTGFLCLPPKTKSLILLETLKGKNIRTICLDSLQVTFYFLSWVHHHLGTILMFFRPWMACWDAVEFSGKTNRICVNFICDVPEASANPQKLLRIFKTNPAPAKSSWLCKDPSAARMA